MDFDAAANCSGQFFFDQDADQFGLALRLYQSVIHTGFGRS
jgi:hypothetical protein